MLAPKKNHKYGKKGQQSKYACYYLPTFSEHGPPQAYKGEAYCYKHWYYG